MPDKDTILGLGILAFVMIAWLVVLGAFFTWLFGTAAGIATLVLVVAFGVLSATICMSSNARRYAPPGHPADYYHADPDDVGQGGIDAGWYER